MFRGVESRGCITSNDKRERSERAKDFSNCSAVQITVRTTPGSIPYPKQHVTEIMVVQPIILTILRYPSKNVEFAKAIYILQRQI